MTTGEYLERVSELSHELANVTQEMYYAQDSAGLEVLIKDMEALTEHARNCAECVKMLSSGGDVYGKIYLLLEYLGRKGTSEEFVSGLEFMMEQAQAGLTQTQEGDVNAEAETRMLRMLRKVLDEREVESEMLG